MSTGCSVTKIIPTKYEINNLALIQIIAIDKGSDGNIRVTISNRDFEKILSENETNQGESSQKNEPNKDKKELNVIWLEGKTVGQIMRKFEYHINKNLFFGYLDYSLLGEDAARENIPKYLSYILREPKVRLNSLIYIVKGNAGELLEKRAELNYPLSNFINMYVENKKTESKTYDLKLLKLISKLAEPKYSGLAIPLLNINEENGQIFADLSGYGIIKNRKLVGYIEDDAAKGYNFLTNKVKKDVLQIKDSEQGYVSLEITALKTKLIPVVDEKTLTGVIIEVQVESNILEVQSDINYLEEKNFKFLEEKQAELISKIINECLNQAKYLGVDFFDLWKIVNLRHPILWHNINANWKDIFVSLNYNLKISSKINHSYELKAND